MEASIEKLHQVFKTMVYGENTENTSQAKVNKFKPQDGVMCKLVK